MIGRFAERNRTIVARGAGPDCLDVVNERQVAPRRGQVATFTEIRRLGMGL